MENEKLLQMIEELQMKINDLENREAREKGFWNRAFSKMHVLAGVMLSVMITSVVLYAADLVEFIDGTTISAEEVNGNFADIDTRLKAMEATFAGVTRADNVIQFSGVNVQIVSGSGATNGTVNGFGNLIVGYNEFRGSGDVRTGSHNIIVGTRNNYSSFGGVVAGYQNTISGMYASVSGGSRSTASGSNSSISGGDGNTASGSFTSVSGGAGNSASVNSSSISGGFYNTASGHYSSVSGGYKNTASFEYTSVSGGYINSTTTSYQVLP